MKASTVIVGGGIIGLTCAYELSRRGEDVVVLDRHEPGAACSAGNAGWIVPSFSAPVPAPGLPRKVLNWALGRDNPLHLNLRTLMGLLPWLASFLRHCNPDAYHRGLRALARLNATTMDAFDRLAADGINFEMHRAGLLFAFLSEKSMVETRRDLEVMGEFGFPPPRVFEGAAVRGVEPALSEQVVGGLLVEGERHVRPESLNAGLIHRLQQLGVPIHPYTAVTGFEWSGDRVTAVITEHGAVAARQVLIAAGAWSGRLCRQLGVVLPMAAGRGYSITLHDVSVRLKRPLYLDEIKVACTPFVDALRIAGIMEFSGLDERGDPRRVRDILRGMSQYLEGWSVQNVESYWVGLRPMLPDGLPALGRLPGWANVFIASGHGMLGVTLAPVTAHVIAAMMTGEKLEDLSPFDPGRFHRIIRGTSR